eukprot:scaffold1420_cov79-Skeletonema_marinoi.AAC.3
MEMVPRIELVSVDLRNSVPSQTVLDLRVTEAKHHGDGHASHGYDERRSKCSGFDGSKIETAILTGLWERPRWDGQTCH